MKNIVSFLAIASVLLIAGCTSTNQVTQQTPRYVSLEDNQVFALEAAPLKHEINGAELDMYAYNGQIPGPTIKTKQGSTIYINFTNKLNEDTTIHWHGIRLNNSFDGVPGMTQAAVKPGETFLYKIYLPDYGIYWYHPHIREDKQQELGLYGNIIVDNETQDGNELVLILDDIKIARDEIEKFYGDFVRFALMGRFGNYIILNGQSDYETEVEKGVTTLYITNAANARPFNFSIEKHDMKIIGGDSGKYEKEFLARSVIISPGERIIAEVLFNETGSFKMKNTNPSAEYAIGRIIVTSGPSQAGAKKFPDAEEFDSFRGYVSAQPDYDFELTMETTGMSHQGHGGGMMSSGASIEWEDNMGMMNAISTDKNTRWIIKDRKTGKENGDIVNEVGVGSTKKIRIFNNPKSMHPMQHPMHLHGQRFIVLSENDKTNYNMVWKDTVLVPTGSTTDILVNFTNPGKWMFHCHIAEHLESGMMAMFEVVE